MLGVPQASAEALAGAASGGRAPLTRMPASQPVMMAAAPALAPQGPPPQQWVSYPQAQRPVVVQVPASAPVITAAASPVATATASPVRMLRSPDSPQQAIIAPQLPTLPMTTANLAVVPGVAPQVVTTTVIEAAAAPQVITTAVPTSPAAAEVAAAQGGLVVGTAASVEVVEVPEFVQVVEAPSVEVHVQDEPVKSQNSFVYSSEQAGQEVLIVDAEDLASSPGRPGQLDAGAAGDMAPGELLQLEELQNFVGQLAETQQQHGELLAGLPGLEEFLLRRIEEQMQVGVGQNVEAMKEEIAALVKEELAAFEVSVMQHLEGRTAEPLAASEENARLQAQIDELRAELASSPSHAHAEAPDFANLQAQVDELRSAHASLAGEHRDTVVVQLEQLRSEMASMPGQGTEAQGHAEFHAHLEQLRGDLAQLSKDHSETLPAQLEELHLGLAQCKAAQGEAADALEGLRGGLEGSILARLEAQVQELRAELCAELPDTQLRLTQLSEKVDEVASELKQQDFLINEMRGFDLGTKIPLIEEVQQEQKLFFRELNNLSLPSTISRLEAAVEELRAADLRPALEREVQALHEQIEALQAQTGECCKDLASVAGMQRELEQTLVQQREQDVGAAELQARLEKLERSHEQHRQEVSSTLGRQGGAADAGPGLRQLQADLEEPRGAPQSLDLRLTDVHQHAQSLDERQRLHEAEVLGRLQGLEAYISAKQAEAAYEPETELQVRGLQEAVERLQDDHRQLYNYVGANQDSLTRNASEDMASRVEERMTSALEAEVTRRCMLVADLHQRLAKEVAVVSRHVELRWEELAARIEAESVARKDGFSTLRKSMHSF